MSIFCALGAFVLSLIVCWRLTEPSSRWHVVDDPNERSLHIVAKPRSGGLGILPACLIAWIPVCWAHPQWHSLLFLLLPTFTIAAVSLLDDLGKVNPFARLLVHMAAATVIVVNPLSGPIYSWLHALWWPSPALGVIFGILAIGWMVNLYNFMDGMDGFTAFMSIVGFGSLAYLGWLQGDSWYATCNLIVASACAGFLILNFPPSLIFLGDAGACTLGLLAALSSLWGLGSQLFPFWVPLLIFAPFTSDASLTLLIRMARLKRVWIGGRNHFYHKILLRIGHRRSLLVYYPLMLASSLSTLAVFRWAPEQHQALLLGWTALYLLLYTAIQRYAGKTPVLKEYQNPAEQQIHPV